METPLQTAARLLAALEDLAAQESSLLRTLEFVNAVAIQERAAPLVLKLGELGRFPEVAVLQPRVAALLARRTQNRHYIDAELARLQAELRRVDEARVRLAGLAPAYSASASPIQSRLNTAA